MQKYIYSIAIIFLALLLMPVSWAGCTVSNPTSYTATIPATTISIGQDKPWGPIGDVISIPTGPDAGVVCTNPPVQVMLKYGTAMPPSPFFPDVYNTNVPGIGIKVWDDFVSSTGWAYGFDIAVNNNLQYWYSWPPGYLNLPNRLTGMKIQFYKIGEVTTGKIQLPSPLVEGWVNTSVSAAGAVRYGVVNVVSSNISLKIAACQTPDISVDMKKNSYSDFPAVGSTSKPVPFKFQINNCDAGMSAVSYTFKPASGVTLQGSGTGQYLTLKNDSTASGVGIQLQYENGNNVPFNTKTKFEGYSGAGSYTVPMQARFIRTGKIKGGTANSAVQFEMTYE